METREEVLRISAQELVEDMSKKAPLEYLKAIDVELDQVIARREAEENATTREKFANQ
jgi:hypothetical protein